MVRPFLFSLAFGFFFHFMNVPFARAEESTCGCDVKIYIFRGAFNVFSLGADKLTERLSEVGFSPKSLNHCYWRSTISEIVEQHRCHPETKFVLIGHSYGADATIRAARQLESRNVFVDLIVNMETVHFTCVSKNVGVALNFHRSRPILDYIPVWRGLPIYCEDGHGNIENIDLRHHPDFQNPFLSHIQVDDHPWIHEQILERVQNLRAAPCTPCLAPRVADGIVYEEVKK